MNHRTDERETLVQSGYEAPVRKSLIDPELYWNCPKLALLGLTLICGLLYLRWLPGVWYMRLLLAGALWLVGVLLMARLTQKDPQWMEVGMDATKRSGRLEVG